MPEIFLTKIFLVKYFSMTYDGDSGAHKDHTNPDIDQKIMIVFLIFLESFNPCILGIILLKKIQDRLCVAFMLICVRIRH